VESPDLIGRPRSRAHRPQGDGCGHASAPV